MSTPAIPSLPGNFGSDSPPPYTENVPQNLRRATARLQFPPSYVVVGVYRFCTDKNLYVPAWKKCQHGVVRGLGVGLVWVRCRNSRACSLDGSREVLQAVSTFKLQRWVVEHFYMKYVVSFWYIMVHVLTSNPLDIALPEF